MRVSFFFFPVSLCPTRAVNGDGGGGRESRRLTRRFRKAIDALTEGGTLFSTLDEKHYNVSD